jgi:hypothetical protein
MFAGMCLQVTLYAYCLLVMNMHCNIIFCIRPRVIISSSLNFMHFITALCTLSISASLIWSPWYFNVNSTNYQVPHYATFSLLSLLPPNYVLMFFYFLLRFLGVGGRETVKKDRQYTYDVTLWRVRIGIVAVEKQNYYIFGVYVSVLALVILHAKCMRLFILSVACLGASYFCTLSHIRYDNQERKSCLKYLSFEQ